MNIKTINGYSLCDETARGGGTTNSSRLDKVEKDIGKLNETIKSVLCGKKIAVDGDSICYGNGYTGGFGKIIADKYNMQLQNNGVGGATLYMGSTDTVAFGTALDWENTDYYVKVDGYLPIEKKKYQSNYYPYDERIIFEWIWCLSDSLSSG